MRESQQNIFYAFVEVEIRVKFNVSSENALNAPISAIRTSWWNFIDKKLLLNENNRFVVGHYPLIFLKFIFFSATICKFRN